MSEVWKDIPNYEGLYQASDFGQIKSFDASQKINNKWGGITTRVINGSILKHIVIDGYHYVNLYKNRKSRRYSVGGLILSSFIGPMPVGMERCHNDGVKSNNTLLNLRYDTHLENITDKIKHGTYFVGEQCTSSKLTECQVIDIRTRRNSGETAKSIADDFNVNPIAVRRVCTGVTWKHVGGPIIKQVKRR